MAAETGSEREARLQRNSEGQRGQQSQLPLFEQPSVQAKMRKFHAEIAALEMQKCTTCSERAYFFFGRTFDLVSGQQYICACAVPHPLCT